MDLGSLLSCARTRFLASPNPSQESVWERVPIQGDQPFVWPLFVTSHQIRLADSQSSFSANCIPWDGGAARKPAETRSELAVLIAFEQCFATRLT